MAVLMPDTAVVGQDATGAPDAAGAKLALTPPAGDFGTVLIGANSGPIDFTIANTGDAASGVPALTVTGEFHIESHSCVNPLPVGGGCVARVRLMPISAGLKNGTLTAFASPGGSATVPLTGYGADQAQLEVQPTSFTFPSTPPGSDSSSVTFIVKNNGGLTSGTPGVTVAGNDTAAFVVTNNGCTSPLGSGSTCLVTMVFRSTSPVGGRNATLSVVASPGGTASSTLQGDATFVEVTPTVYDFGDWMVGGSNSKNHGFTVKNIAPAGGPYLTIMYMLSNVSDFRSSTDCPASGNLLAPGAICQIGVDFAPLSPGPKSAQVDIAAHESSGLPAGAAKAAVTGNGI
jgi:hypothetical protein